MNSAISFVHVAMLSEPLPRSSRREPVVHVVSRVLATEDAAATLAKTASSTLVTLNARPIDGESHSLTGISSGK